MRLDDILAAAEEARGGDWIVRKTVDDSGDYPCPTYEVLAVFPYGPEGIGCAYQNPYNAILFAGAKQLAQAVRDQKMEIMALRAKIESLDHKDKQE